MSRLVVLCVATLVVAATLRWLHGVPLAADLPLWRNAGTGGVLVAWAFVFRRWGTP